MRILILNQYYPPDASNTARLLEDLVDDLARDHAVHVIAGRPSYNAHVAREEARDAGTGDVRVQRVRSLALGRSNLATRALNYVSYLALSLVASLRAPRPDVIVAQTDPPIIGLVAAIAAARFRCRFVFICHDVHPDIGQAMGVASAPLVVKAWRLVNRVIRGRADTVVVVGRDMRAKLAAEGVDPRKLVYVPTWAPDEPSPPPDRLRELRRQQGWDGRFVVMHAGNIGLAQNVSILARAAEHLRDFEEVLIVVMGDGAARPQLEAEIRRRGLTNIVITPYRPRAEAHELMAAADAHVVSLIPGLWGCAAPSKTYAIMAMARPFAAAVDPGSEPALIAEEWDCGRVVPADDAQALANALRELRHAPRDELGARARRAFEAQFSATACIGRLRRVIA